MPSFGDSAFIFILALLLFGPKRLPELARQLGKLMAEFRRASNEFRMQMDEELRLADQAEQQRKIAAIEAAAPIAPPIGEVAPEPETPYPQDPATEPLPIASEGDLSLMPPSTGLPTPRGTDSYTSPDPQSDNTEVSDNTIHSSDPYASPANDPMESTATPNDDYASSLPDRHTHNTTDEAAQKSEAPLHG
ncbi:twin-arginine translocase TatA/TatE family subunit [Granulicella sp. dw_53]|uniref:Sec-independent protein translocase subunit TatA/TatB n=1 Tax=Granulicella sp. dw_53 TaxID=2719792 RepID=UPI001BD62541|nr:twin-arginine translocase TatA/TatE family subunit [Granulicella sp. dw_53]